MNKISIIGTGSVGSTIAYTLTVMGLASEIVMIDINNEKALGEALDIRQGTPFCGACSIYAGDYRDAADSDIVILTSGVARKAGQSRLELAQINVNITKMIIPEITKYAPNATYIIVSNPVDILTYTFNKFSDIPESRIIGSGTILDTARLRARLSEYYNINQGNVHAYVFGEHGDSSFIPWSVANISNIPIMECPKLIKTPGIENPELNLEEIEQYVRKSGGRVIARKGATFYAIAMTANKVCDNILRDANTIMTVSTLQDGSRYGINDVCLSLPAVVGRHGIEQEVNPALTDEEVQKLQDSAKALRNVIDQIDI